MGGQQSKQTSQLDGDRSRRGRMNRDTFVNDMTYVQTVLDNIIEHYEYGLNEQYCNNLRVVIRDDILSQFAIDELRALNGQIFLVDANKYEQTQQGKATKQRICQKLAGYYVKKINLLCILCKTVIMMHRRLNNLTRRDNRTAGICFPPPANNDSNDPNRLRYGLNAACWKKDPKDSTCSKIEYNLPVVSESSVTRGINGDSIVSEQEIMSNLNISSHDEFVRFLQLGKHLQQNRSRVSSQRDQDALNATEFLDDEVFKKLPIARVGNVKNRLNTEPLFDETFILQIREKAILGANIPNEKTNDLFKYISYLEIYDKHDCVKTKGVWTTEEKIIDEYYLNIDKMRANIDNPYAKEWIERFHRMEDITYLHLDIIVSMIQNMIESRTAYDEGKQVTKYFDKLVPVGVLVSYMAKAREVISSLFIKTDALYLSMMDLSIKMRDTLHYTSKPQLEESQLNTMKQQQAEVAAYNQDLIKGQYLPSGSTEQLQSEKREEGNVAAAGGSGKRRRSRKVRRRSRSRRYKK